MKPQIILLQNLKVCTLNQVLVHIDVIWHLYKDFYQNCKNTFILQCRVRSLFPLYAFSETDKFLIGCISWFCCCGGMVNNKFHVFSSGLHQPIVLIKRIIKFIIIIIKLRLKNEMFYVPLKVVEFLQRCIRHHNGLFCFSCLFVVANST